MSSRTRTALMAAAAAAAVAGVTPLLFAADAAKPAAAPAAPAPAAKQFGLPQPGDPPFALFGHGWHRNIFDPSAKGVPDDWDPTSGRNVKWVATLGSQSYAGPVIYRGMVFVGTNNEAKKNPKLTGDRGNVMAFDLATGELVWQSAHPKLAAGRVNDWPLQGVCSTPHVEGEVVYYVSNRAEIIAADIDGFRDGTNDGPFTAETETSEIDEDILWRYDLIGTDDVFPHNLAAGSPLVVDGILYTVTGNGVDEGHINIPSPKAPSFVALDAKTGKLLWKDSTPGDKIFHGTWSNPSYAVIKGRAQVIFPGGDGWVYSFEPKTGKLLWKYDGNPKGAVYELGGSGTANEFIGMGVVWEDKVYIAVGQDPEHGEGEGHLHAIDASLDGDITEKGRVWHRGFQDFNRSISTVAIDEQGILYAADLSGYLYALDARTGQLHWTYNVFAAIWGSPYVADGKVYLGDEDGDVAILRAGKGKDGKPELLREINMGSAVYTTPVARDGVLYIVTRNKLFAIETGAQSTPPGKAAPAAVAE
jgi:outer membrane protein assembly factor BamB